MRNQQRHPGSEGGFTLLETIVAMSLFAIGVLALAQVQFAASRSNMSSRSTSTATMLASDRIEEIMNTPAFDSISPALYGDEDYGQVDGGDQRYGNYKRSVTIVDQLDVAGRVALKTVTVRVSWQTLNGERSAELASNIARY